MSTLITKLPANTDIKRTKVRQSRRPLSTESLRINSVMLRWIELCVAKSSANIQISPRLSCKIFRSEIQQKINNHPSLITPYHIQHIKIYNTNAKIITTPGDIMRLHCLLRHQQMSLQHCLYSDLEHRQKWTWVCKLQRAAVRLLHCSSCLLVDSEARASDPAAHPTHTFMHLRYSSATSLAAQHTCSKLASAYVHKAWQICPVMCITHNFITMLKRVSRV